MDSGQQWDDYRARMRLLGIPPGTHIKGAATAGMDHHAIYCSPGEIIHYIQNGGSSSGPSSGCQVQQWTFARFVEVFPLWRVVQFPNGEDHGARVVGNARSKLGNLGYNLISNNCEHFARKCFNDVIPTSEQVVGAGAAVMAGGGLAIFAVDEAAVVAAATATSTAVDSLILGAALANAAVTVPVGLGLHLWGQSRVAGRVPILVSNQSTDTITVQMQVVNPGGPMMQNAARIGVLLKSKVFRHGTSPIGTLVPGVAHEFNPPTEGQHFQVDIEAGGTPRSHHGNKRRYCRCSCAGTALRTRLAGMLQSL